MKNKHGQYFTTNEILKDKVIEFIHNNPQTILEPSVGRGDLCIKIINKYKDIILDLYEIDDTIESILPQEYIINYCDFLKQNITIKYPTIVANPPYIKSAQTNIYIQFIEKCFSILEENGELIFIVPSNFFKTTSAYKILKKMYVNGVFTHIFHPHNEHMFENATVDVIIFRYQKTKNIEKKCIYNNKELYTYNGNNIIYFLKDKPTNVCVFENIFHIYVGMVSGKESVFQNDMYGNTNILTGNEVYKKYILIEKFPTDNNALNEYLLKYKHVLMSRKIRHFTEKNWFEWGALRNKSYIEAHYNKPCIYIHTLTRNDKVAFIGQVCYFNGNLLILIPKMTCNLQIFVDYINNDIDFKNNFMFSGRFSITHNNISNFPVNPSLI
jgi:adenine-specific DNA-methyltransferase